MATLGERMKLLIREKGLEQQEVAESLGMKTSTFNGYIGNKREPSIENLIKFAGYFNVSIDYLIGHSDVKNPYLTHLSKEQYTFLQDPKNKVYIELAMDIKKKTLTEESAKKMIG